MVNIVMIQMNLIINILLLFLLLQNACSFSIKSHSSKELGCNIFLKDKTLPRILYLKPFLPTDGYAFYWPDPRGNVKFEKKQNVNLQCPGSKVVADTKIMDTSVIASCESNDKFSINNVQYDYKKIGCLEKIKHVAKVHDEVKCYNNFDLIHIQFELKDKSLFQVQVCFDKFSGRTLYAHHLVPNIIEGSQSSSERPRFIQGSFYNEIEKNINLNNLYYITNQKKLINELVGLPLNSNKYVDENSNKKFLSKGHLAPNSDFVYSVQRDLTFYYINTAPQWQSVNGGNWETLEKDVRKYIAINYDNNVRDFIIYTGTEQIATLPHATNNNMIELYLYKGTAGRFGIPVPRYFVKFVYHPQTSKGIAFFTVNNPYIKPEEVPEYKKICKDISDSINWLTWKKNDIELGVSFACDPKLVSKIMPYFPRFKVTGLLPNIYNVNNYTLTTN